MNYYEQHVFAFLVAYCVEQYRRQHARQIVADRLLTIAKSTARS